MGSSDTSYPLKTVSRGVFVLFCLLIVWQQIKGTRTKFALFPPNILSTPSEHVCFGDHLSLTANEVCLVFFLESHCPAKCCATERELLFSKNTQW